LREFRADTGVGAGVLHLEGHERDTWRGCPGAVASWAACKRVTLLGECASATGSSLWGSHAS